MGQLALNSFGCNHLAGGRNISRRGFYRRTSDGKAIQRFYCSGCNQSFGAESSHLYYRHKKRHLNGLMLRLYMSGMSERRISLELNINRKTFVRKFLLLGGLAFKSLHLSFSDRRDFKSVEFDELETFEHTKYKPLSVPVLVESKSRKILAFRVASMPAKGKLAKGALKRYGYRPDHRTSARRSLLKEIKLRLTPNAKIKSDMNPHYTLDIKEILPDCTHEVFKGRRGCVVGQGELKAGGFDPLFSLNHSNAMLRANINRLFRRTWCTTKKAKRLELHIALYAIYHNLKLTGKTQRTHSLLSKVFLN